MNKDKWMDHVSTEIRELSSKVNPKLWVGIKAKIATPVFLGMSMLTVKIVGVALFVVGVSGTTIIAYNMKTFTDTEQQQTDPKQIVEDNTGTKGMSANKLTDEKRWSTAYSKANDDIANVENTINGISNVVELKATDIAGTDALSSNENTLSVSDRKKSDADKKMISSSSNELEKAGVSALFPSNLRSSKKVDAVEIETVKLIKLPNTLSRNSETGKDVFSVLIDGISNYKLVVIDYRNDIVWESQNMSDTWTGVNQKGEKVETGNYVYYITGIDVKGKK